jgi:hypothetical protein
VKTDSSFAGGHSSRLPLIQHSFADTSIDTMSTPEPRFLDLPIDAGRPLKVICLGAGYSGILSAIRLPQRIPNLELVIYEKNDDIGGTWYENQLVGPSNLQYSDH